jgi:hypothetical protein
VQAGPARSIFLNLLDAECAVPAWALPAVPARP